MGLFMALKYKFRIVQGYVRALLTPSVSAAPTAPSKIDGSHLKLQIELLNLIVELYQS